jgi:uncharacterized protein (TIGR00661 family)
MAKIFYAISGEGNGHSTRSIAVIEELLKRHEVIAFTSKRAVTALRSRCPTVYEIPGFSLSRRKNKVSVIKTFLTNSRLLMKQYKDIIRLREIVEREKPDLIITDFEPFMCRVARNTPVISIDNQQLIMHGNIPILSNQISEYLLAKNLVRMYYSHVDYSIATYFCRVGLKKDFPITLVDPIIRQEIVNSKPHKGGYILVYSRSTESAKILDFLSDLPYKFHFFGADLHTKSLPSNVIHHGTKFGPEFLEYLVNADAVICTAGLSLICEAVYLQKPVFAIPERKDFEQFFNAYMVKEHNFGSYQYLHKLTEHELREFLESLETFSKTTLSPNGAKQAAMRVEAYLQRIQTNGFVKTSLKVRKSSF